MQDIDRGMSLTEFTDKWGLPDKNNEWDDPERIHFGRGGIDIKIGADGKLKTAMIYLPL